MLAYDQAHFSALVSMEQKENGKEQGAEHGVCVSGVLGSVSFSPGKTEMRENRGGKNFSEVQAQLVCVDTVL